MLVNKELAILAREKTVEYFNERSLQPNHPIAKMATKALDFEEYNTWDRVFDATTTRPSVGLRLPFSDKRAQVLRGSRKEYEDEFRQVP